MQKRRRLLIGALVLPLAAAAVFLRKPVKRLLATPKTRTTGRFQDPEGMAVDRLGNIYVADEDWKTLWMLDKTGATLAKVTALEGLDTKVTDGDSIAVIEPGHIVAIGPHVLLEIKFEGAQAKLVRVIGRRGHGDGEFEDPEGISRDVNGDLYATDEDHRRILVFDRKGQYLRAIKVDHDPESICVFEDRVYVTFSKNGYVGCYSKEGQFRFKFGGDVLSLPDYVCVSPNRKVYVTDQKANCIRMFE